MSDLETNKRVVMEYYQTAFGGDPEKAVVDHLGDRYIQHNPDAADGPEAFIGFPLIRLFWCAPTPPPCKRPVPLPTRPGIRASSRLWPGQCDPRRH
jgi:hypothetical protein